MKLAHQRCTFQLSSVEQYPLSFFTPFTMFNFLHSVHPNIKHLHFSPQSHFHKWHGMTVMKALHNVWFPFSFLACANNSFSFPGHVVGRGQWKVGNWQCPFGVKSQGTLLPSLSLHYVISLGPRVRRVLESTAETQRLHRVKRHKSFVLLFTVQYVCIILIHLFFIEVDSIST